MKKYQTQSLNNRTLSRKFIYLIGPSGAGKSTIASELDQKQSEIRHIDLDDVMKAKYPLLFDRSGDRWEEFWGLAVACIDDLSRSFQGASLIDCGAGCLQMDSALDFFKSQKTTVAFIGDPALIHARAKISKPKWYWASRTPEEYKAAEFSERRKRFYEAAAFSVDVTSLSKAEAIARLVEILKNTGEN